MSEENEMEPAGMPESPLSLAETKENGVTKTETVQKILVSIDKTNEQVLQLNMDEGIRLVWDGDDFRDLPEAVEKQLRHENLKSYWVAQTKAREKGKRALQSLKLESPLNPLGMNTESRLKIRERVGWHQCWKSPGGELDAALAGPYRQVRKQALLKGKDGKQVLDKWNQPKEEEKAPGEENGEVLKLLDENQKVELVAVECPLELYLQYLQWMSDKSRSMYLGNKARFSENVEQLNRNLKRDMRMKVIDEAEE